jgi:DNA-directed RNA polymerase omega subunit
MARVTVEDCTKIIKNRFELVVLSSRRAKDISTGAEVCVDKRNDKDAVLALREIADRKITRDQLYEEIIQSYQDTSSYKAVSSTPNKPFGSTESRGEGMFAEDNVDVED